MAIRTVECVDCGATVDAWVEIGGIHCLPCSDRRMARYLLRDELDADHRLLVDALRALFYINDCRGSAADASEESVCPVCMGEGRAVLSDPRAVALLAEAKDDGDA